LDLYSIKKLKGKIDGMSISLCGDLKYGRTVHSLGMALTNYDVNIKLAAPPTLRMKPAVIEQMKKAGMNVAEVDSIEEAVKDADVVYMTRIQKERFPDPMEYDKVRGKFSITTADVKMMRDDAIILHPLPRVDELSAEVDNYPQAKYFDQVYNGVIVRMAILKMILG
jgi:aspartate carbamoyltransferase catalytic subunit